MSKPKAWISAMRLRTLPLSFSVIIVGNAMAYGQTYFIDCGDILPRFNWSIFGLTLLTTLLLQVLSNFANDYGDTQKGADNEGRIGPERAVQSGVISPKEMLAAIIITSLLSLVSGSYLIYLAFAGFTTSFFWFLGLGVLSILAAIGYTMGKKAYGYLGLGDLFVFIFFGMVGVYGSYYLHFHDFDLPTLIFAVIMGCFCTAVLNLNNMRDQENDKAVGKITLAVRLGFSRSKIYHYILFIIAWLPIFLIFIPQIHREWRAFSFFLPVLLIHIVHLKKVYSIQDPKDFDPELKKVALSSFLYSILLFTSIYLDAEQLI